MKPLSTAILAAALLAAFAPPATARDFLSDGGGIRRDRSVPTPFGRVELDGARHGSRRTFLGGSGGIRSDAGPGRYRDGAGRRYDRESRSVSRFHGRDRGYGDVANGEPSRRVSNQSVIYIAAPPALVPAFLEDEGSLPRQAGPKIIDVASERLDRRPYGEDGLDIVYSGATKIIRVSPGFRRGGRVDAKDDLSLETPRNGTRFSKLSPAEQAVTVYPDADAPSRDGSGLLEAPPPPAARISVPRPAPSPAPALPEAPRAAVEAPTAPVPTATGFEPWTADWLRDCVARHPDFDASLGTYIDATGRRRFCTGET